MLAATTRGAKPIVNSTSQSPITANLVNLNRRDAGLMDQVFDQLEDPETTISERIAGLGSVAELLPACRELVNKHGGDPHEIWDLDPLDLKGRTYELMARLKDELLHQMEDPKSTEPEHVAALNLLSELLPLFWQLYPMGLPLKKYSRAADKNPPEPAATATEPRDAKLIVSKDTSASGKPNKRSAVEAPAISTGERPLKRRAPMLERVKAEMRAKVKARERTIDELLRDKNSWAIEFKCGATTARQAAREVQQELAQEQKKK